LRDIKFAQDHLRSTVFFFERDGGDGGATFEYFPKNAIDFAPSRPNSKRHPPSTRRPASQETRDMPVAFGAHQRMSSSGLCIGAKTEIWRLNNFLRGDELDSGLFD
jgi:hypothetical protein